MLVRLARERLDNLLLSQGDGVDLERLITYSVLSLRMPRDARTLDRVVSLLLAPEAVDIIAKAEGGESIPSRLVAADVLKPSFLSLLSAMDTNAAFRRQLPRFFLLLVQSNSLSSLIVADGLLSLLASTEAFSSAVRRLALPLFVAEKAAGGSAKAATESVMPVAPPKPVLPFSLSNALQCDVVADTLRIVMDASNIRQLVGGFLPREGAGKILSSPRAPLRALCEYLSSSQAAGGIPADEVLQLCMAGNLAHGFANQSLADDVSYKVRAAGLPLTMVLTVSRVLGLPGGTGVSAAAATDGQGPVARVGAAAHFRASIECTPAQASAGLPVVVGQLDVSIWRSDWAALHGVATGAV